MGTSSIIREIPGRGLHSFSLGMGTSSIIRELPGRGLHSFSLGMGTSSIIREIPGRGLHSFSLGMGTSSIIRELPGRGLHSFSLGMGTSSIIQELPGRGLHSFSLGMGTSGIIRELPGRGLHSFSLGMGTSSIIRELPGRGLHSFSLGMGTSSIIRSATAAPFQVSLVRWRNWQKRRAKLVNRGRITSGANNRANNWTCINSRASFTSKHHTCCVLCLMSVEENSVRVRLKIQVAQHLVRRHGKFSSRGSLFAQTEEWLGVAASLPINPENMAVFPSPSPSFLLLLLNACLPLRRTGFDSRQVRAWIFAFRSHAAGRRVFSGIYRFRPYIQALLHTHLASPSPIIQTLEPPKPLHSIYARTQLTLVRTAVEFPDAKPANSWPTAGPEVAPLTSNTQPITGQGVPDAKPANSWPTAGPEVAPLTSNTQPITGQGVPDAKPANSWPTAGPEVAPLTSNTQPITGQGVPDAKPANSWPTAGPEVAPLTSNTQPITGQGVMSTNAPRMAHMPTTAMALRCTISQPTDGLLMKLSAKSGSHKSSHNKANCTSNGPSLYHFTAIKWPIDGYPYFYQ
ncbi:hypothetical protein PR048_003909 [Dryococelus australis]|uniref:Uncharacterized protein n=1 Tax=Dryococelus australis TaxID=614101 RepID=A0ABQ9IPF7_9NEOP|nr:hypothetical protein PR048_003909 [Dryococelus australis]